jgi:hypothetical protein
MPWSGLLHPRAAASYKHLVLRFEDSEGPEWLVRLYDGDKVIVEAVGDDPPQALFKVVAAAREYLKDPCVTVEDFVWVQT